MSTYSMLRNVGGKSMKKCCIIFFMIMAAYFPSCYAKQICTEDGRVSFTTSPDWYYANCPGDIATYGILATQLDRDTIIMFKQSKIKYKIDNLSRLTKSQRSVYRDNLLRYHIELLKAGGYDVYINKTDMDNYNIYIGLTATRYGQEYKVLTAYSLRNYIIYSITIMGRLDTIWPAVNVAKTLRIDGIPWDNWNGVY